MRWQLIVISAAVLIFIINAAPFSGPTNGIFPQVIYGNDDRKDIYQVDDPNLLAMADATVGLFRITRIEVQGDTTRLLTAPYGASNNLCASEPYYNQEMGPSCTGFLVAPDLIVSAGHCVQSQLACDRTKFVFGFKITEEGVNPRSVPTSEVYSCKELVYSVVPKARRTAVPGLGEDFSIIRLDRPVVGHTPLNLRMQGEPQVDQDLMVMGHPASLPLKIAGGAKIRAVYDEYFVANLDTYGGNSGSPVFNVQTGEVEGVLVRGENDFVLKNNCYVSNVCPDTGCRGEDVTRINRVLAHLEAEQLFKRP